MERTVVLTADGSSSIFVPDFDEHYHSVHGAMQESLHVFINAGLNYMAEKQKTISILEVGFGTGLNALLTYFYANKADLTINYTALEKFPLEMKLVETLNYPEILNIPQATEILNTMHALTWNAAVNLSTQFLFNKRHIDLLDFLSTEQFDVIYFDAFAPSAQPELWTVSVFENMFNALKNNGILTTYCAKGSVKRSMKEVGFKIESLTGPIGKREMTRARK